MLKNLVLLLWLSCVAPCLAKEPAGGGAAIRFQADGASFVIGPRLRTVIVREATRLEAGEADLVTQRLMGAPLGKFLWKGKWFHWSAAYLFVENSERGIHYRLRCVDVPELLELSGKIIEKMATEKVKRRVLLGFG